MYYVLTLPPHIYLSTAPACTCKEGRGGSSDARLRMDSVSAARLCNDSGIGDLVLIVSLAGLRRLADQSAVAEPHAKY